MNVEDDRQGFVGTVSIGKLLPHHRGEMIDIISEARHGNGTRRARLR